MSAAILAAEAACRTEGVTLADLAAKRPKQRGPRRDYWGTIFDIVACRLVTAGHTYADTGAAIGAAHSTVMAAVKRGRRVLDARANNGVALIGNAMASGLTVCTPNRPMFDDGGE